MCINTVVYHTVYEFRDYPENNNGTHFCRQSFNDFVLAAPTARKLDFKEPSPPKRGRPTRAQDKKKQSYVTGDISHGTSSSSSSALESISGIIQISEDK